MQLYWARGSKLNSQGSLLKFGGVCCMLCALATPALAVTYVGQTNSGLGNLSWPNPHRYKNFITSGEYCTSTHFTCERPDFEIETASISDVADLGDIPVADPVRKSTYSTRKSSSGQSTGSSGDNTAGTVATSNAGDSPTGSFNGGGPRRSNLPSDPSQPIDPGPPNLSPVPLPNSVWFLFAAVLSLGFFRRQSQRIGNQHEVG